MDITRTLNPKGGIKEVTVVGWMGLTGKVELNFKSNSLALLLTKEENEKRELASALLFASLSLLLSLALTESKKDHWNQKIARNPRTK